MPGDGERGTSNSESTYHRRPRVRARTRLVSGYLMAMRRTIRMRALSPTTAALIATLLTTWTLPSASQTSAAQPGGAPAAAQPPAPNPIAELIRADVEQLRATGDLDLGGVMIASRNLLPR